MTTLTRPDTDNAEVVSLTGHPLATIIAAVRQRCRARKLNFVTSDRCLQVAREHYADHGSLALAIAAGQRHADLLADKPLTHPWKTPPSAA